MTSTDTQGISDEQIDHLWDTRVGDPTPRHPLTKYDVRIFARAVLALQPEKDELPRSYSGSTFDTRPFGAGATVRLHFSDSEETEKWWVSITGRLKERK